MDLDGTDREILRILQVRILQEDGRSPFSEVARRIDVSSETVHGRVSWMEAEGLIEGYHATVDPKTVELVVSAIVVLRVEQGREEETLERPSEIEGGQGTRSRATRKCTSRRAGGS